MSKPRTHRGIATGFAAGTILLLTGCGEQGANDPSSTSGGSENGNTSAGSGGSTAGSGGSTAMPDASAPDSGVGCPTDSMTGPFDSIPSEFDIDSELVQTGVIPPSGAPDTVGAFRFICNASHLSYDDPIVFPGQPGKAHLHQFFGNTEANACSTYESLRKSGMSTCMSPLNRSAYWMPAMMNGKGKVVVPDYVSIYYKRLPKDAAACTTVGKECVPIPRGLRFVFGYNPMEPQRGTDGAWFNCDGPTATPDHYPDIVTAAKNCPNGNKLGAVINAPSCWNGTDLDSADHRSHVAYSFYHPNTGQLQCPDTHPYIIPTFTLGAWYTVDDDLDRSGTWDPSKPTWHLSSDMHPDGTMMMPGSTFHSDWMGAWDDTVMQMWTDHCIDKLLNCSGGDLGNGKQLKMFSGFSWTANPRIVDPPPKP